MIYRPRRVRRTLAIFTCLGTLAVSAPLAALLPVSVNISAAIVALLLILCWFRAKAEYLKVDDQGVAVQNFWKKFDIPWDDITAIEARPFGWVEVDHCLWFVRRSGKAVPATVTLWPGGDGGVLIDALTRAKGGRPLAMPFKAPARPRWYKKGSDSWQVVERS